MFTVTYRRLLVNAVVIIGAMAVSCVAARAADAPSAKPNIVFILADDLGWTDLGCMGSKYYETPNIDRLAAESVRFMRHHHCQNCAPTRAAIMSGQWPQRTGIYTVGNLDRGSAAARKMNVPPNATQLPLDRKTIADQLKAAGYATGMFGKWHLGQGAGFHPSKRGFDEAIVSDGKHFDFVTSPPTEYPKGQYLADFITDRSVAFIEKHKDKPFFLYVPHFAVHSPHVAKPELIAKFKDKPGAGGHDNPTYAAMIASVDESVGRIRAKLDELKLSEQTIVIFSSDNGGVGGYEEIGGKGITDNKPLRGGKGMLYEGGVRVPLFIRWPGVTKPGVCEEPTQHIDWYPTLSEIAGASKPPQKLDGLSFVPLLRDSSAQLPRDGLFAHFPGYLEGYKTNQWRTSPVTTIVTRQWKLLEFHETGKVELYNLQADGSEKQDLAAKEPAKTKELRERLAAWRNETNAAMPTMKTAEQIKADTATPEAPAKKGKGKRKAATEE
jgi:arylsulfatase A-like enzyme